MFCFTDGISVAKLSAAVDLPSDTRKRSDGPRLLLTCLDSGLSVQHVSCGLEHSLFLTQHGTVLTCGSGRYECLGVFCQVILKTGLLAMKKEMVGFKGGEIKGENNCILYNVEVSKTDNSERGNYYVLFKSIFFDRVVSLAHL